MIANVLTYIFIALVILFFLGVYKMDRDVNTVPRKKGRSRPMNVRVLCEGCGTQEATTANADRVVDIESFNFHIIDNGIYVECDVCGSTVEIAKRGK